MAKIGLIFIILLLPFFSIAQEMPEKDFSASGEAIVAPPEEYIEEVDPLPEAGPSTDELNLEDEFNISGPTDVEQEPLPLIKKQRQKIDSRFLQNKRLIQHPNASKGLIKIDKERTYIYRVPVSEQKKAASVRLGVYSPEDLENPDNTNLTFTDLYRDDDFPMLQYDQESIFWRSGLGKMAWKYGVGFYVAQGNGVFANGNPDTPKEQFTILVIPFSFGVSHRFQFWDTQPIVPYVGGGADLFTFAERRDDDLNPDIGARLGAAPAAHFNLGGTIRLGRGTRAFVDLDREYGVNSVSLAIEYKNYIALSDKFDFSSEFIGGGVLIEY